MDRQLDGQMVRWIDSQMDRQLDGQIVGWIESQMDRQLDGQIVRWIDSYMDRYLDGYYLDVQYSQEQDHPRTDNQMDKQFDG